MLKYEVVDAVNEDRLTSYAIKEIPLVATEDGETALLHDKINFSKPIEEWIKNYPSDCLWILRRWKRA